MVGRLVSVAWQHRHTDRTTFAGTYPTGGAASERCVAQCVAIATTIADGQCVAVDRFDAILGEYVGTVAGKGASGFVAKLVRSLWTRRWDPKVCFFVDITPIDAPPGSFAEVPQALQDFDIDDQKFIAVACASGTTPPVYQALDREWWDRRADLVDARLDVQFACSVDLLAAD